MFSSKSMKHCQYSSSNGIFGLTFLELSSTLVRSVCKASASEYELTTNNLVNIVKFKSRYPVNGAMSSVGITGQI